MPAWSPEIANQFIRMAADEQRAFDQMQLQKLVYIAHGLRLALSDEPLTGDRPEAWAYGPMYRRLAEALAEYGRSPVTREITFSSWAGQSDVSAWVRSRLDEAEEDLIARVHHDYGGLPSPKLSGLTLGTSAPWKNIFAGGRGELRDIPHRLIRAQFVKIIA